MTTATDQSTQLVRFGQRQSRGLLLGLWGIRLAAIVFGLACLVGPLFVAGPAGAAITAPLWAGAFGAALARWHGRPVVESVPVVGHWAARSATRQTRHLVRASAPRPAGTMALPGDAASLRFYHDPPSGAAMI